MTLSTINPGDPGLQLTGECFGLRGALISLRDPLFQGFGSVDMDCCTAALWVAEWICRRCMWQIVVVIKSFTLTFNHSFPTKAIDDQLSLQR